VEESVTEWIEVDSARRAEGRLRPSRQGSPSQLPTASPACGGGARMWDCLSPMENVQNHK
jgi:hypothetical protein